MRALLLEDDVTRGQKLRALLEQRGYNVVWARTFRAAQQAWRQLYYDLASLDHDLGNPNPNCCGTGRLFTRWVVMQPNALLTHFIVHSANVLDAPRMVQDLLDAGCSVSRTLPDENNYVAALRAVPKPPADGT